MGNVIRFPQNPEARWLARYDKNHARARAANEEILSNLVDLFLPQPEPIASRRASLAQLENAITAIHSTEGR